jgi:hypothetical protein
MTPRPLSIDAGLLARFRAAGTEIAWRPAGPTPRVAKGRRARIAHLHDEEARIESWGREINGGVEVESGPVGALVLLLEADRRGVPDRLETREAGEDRGFPQGAIVATWGPGASGASKIGPKELVDLARYALA